jgi:hypothetical protein
MLNWDPVYILSHRVLYYIRFHILSNPGHYLKLGHDRFLPHSFKFIIHYHPIIWLFTGCVIITAPSIMLTLKVTIYNNACVLCLGEFWRFFWRWRINLNTPLTIELLWARGIMTKESPVRLYENSKLIVAYGIPSSEHRLRRLPWQAHLWRVDFKAHFPIWGRSGRPCSSLRATSWKQFPFPLHCCRFYWRSSVNLFLKSACSSHTHLLVTSLPW